jgi:hypothetical protein
VIAPLEPLQFYNPENDQVQRVRFSDNVKVIEQPKVSTPATERPATSPTTPPPPAQPIPQPQRPRPDPIEIPQNPNKVDIRQRQEVVVSSQPVPSTEIVTSPTSSLNAKMLSMLKDSFKIKPQEKDIKKPETKGTSRKGHAPPISEKRSKSEAAIKQTPNPMASPRSESPPVDYRSHYSPKAGDSPFRGSKVILIIKTS